MKILTLFGTRPEAIKMAPVVNALKQHAQDNPGTLECHVAVTGQHREMLDQVLTLFDIKPEYDLNIMSKNQSLAGLTARIVTEVDQVLETLKPDTVLVQGDTTTAFAGALACYYHKIPVGHVEAGLRTKHKYDPWPEEMNRTLLADLAQVHFAPTALARDNLVREGIAEDKIKIIGNTVIDALLTVVSLLERNTAVKDKFEKQFSFLNSNKRLVLMTGHRRESFGQGFEDICQGLAHVAERDDVEIVYPVHLNPNVQTPVHRVLGSHPNVHLIEPLDYLAFVYLLQRAYLILTDSGGIQEEAPSLNKPVLVLRDTTERVEAISAGTARLIGTDPKRILQETEELLDQKDLYENMIANDNPYGDGQAAHRIVEMLVKAYDYSE